MSRSQLFLLGLVKTRGRGKLAKLVEISLGRPEQPMFPANHLLIAHKRGISGSQVKGIWAHKKIFEDLVTYWRCSCGDGAPEVFTPFLCVLRSRTRRTSDERSLSPKDHFTEAFPFNYRIVASLYLTDVAPLIITALIPNYKATGRFTSEGISLKE